MKKSFIHKCLIAFLVSLSFLWVKTSVYAYTPQSLYDEVWKLVCSKYVNQDNNGQAWEKWRHKYDDVLQTEEDAYVAIDTMLLSLNDPYTRFLKPEEFEEEGSAISGTLKGIGVQISVKDGKLLVISPIEDTPAAKAGLKANDHIVEIDGTSTKGMTVKDAADKIRGEEGSLVKLLIRRAGVDKVYNVPRAEIKLKAISTTAPDSFALNSRVGYIRLSTFMNKGTTAEFADALVKLKDKDGYIIDLRSNGGGYMSVMCSICEYLCNTGNSGEFLCTTATYKNGKKEDYKAKSNKYNQYGTNHSKLFRQHCKNKIRMFFRQKIQMALCSVQKPFSEYSARPQSNF